MTGAGVSTIVFVWRLDRTDGVTIGFTAHDHDLWIDGLMYRARPGLLPTSMKLALGTRPDSIELNGALSDASIGEADLMAGRWDAARLSVARADWSSATIVEWIFAGEIGTVARVGTDFKAAVLGVAALLDGPVVPETSAGCRAQFGDGDCGVARERFRTRAHAVACAGAVVTVDALPVGLVPDAFVHGALRWLDGANAGLTSTIVAQSGLSLTLMEAPAVTPALPGRVALTQGCDHSLTTCRNRFANVVNMRAEPYLPGNDILTRYPGG